MKNAMSKEKSDLLEEMDTMLIKVKQD